jgi:TRAP transporter TAXI family solute receptor
MKTGVLPLRGILPTLAFSLLAPMGIAQELTDNSGIPELRLFTLASGDVAGNYYASAAAICDAINRQEGKETRCSPDPTSGSLYNIEALRSGQVDFAYAQSDWHRWAFAGEGPYVGRPPMTDMRSVMSLYGETLTIVARRDSGIASIEDLRDKRVDLGPPSSGRRGTVDSVLSTLGFDMADFALVAELPSGIALDAICQGTVDAAVLVVGHPNVAVARTIEECGASLVPLMSRERGAIIRESPEMLPSAIKADTYAGMTETVPSVSVIATVVTLADTDPDLVALFVTDTLENMALLARKAPVLAHIEPAQMRRSGLSAPLHPGAVAAFDAALGPETQP